MFLRRIHNLPLLRRRMTHPDEKRKGIRRQIFKGDS